MVDIARFGGRLALALVLGLFFARLCQTDEVCEAEQTNAVTTAEERAVYVPGATVGDYWLEQHLYCLGYTQEYDSDPAFSVPRLAGADEPVAHIGHKAVFPSQNIPVGAEFVMNGSYCLNGLHGKGSHGEVWRARRISSDGSIDNSESFVLKRMRVSDFPDILHCALREVFFGKKFQHSQRIARFVDHFYQDGDMWLIFVDEGVSLQQFLYAMRYAPAHNHHQTPFLEPSLFWLKLRTTDQGKEVMRALLLQLIQATTELQGAAPIVHRDIKPSNLLINSEGPPLLKLADFSSALSTDAVLSGLYPSAPSGDEESEGYQPPEVVFDQVDRVDLYLRQHPSAYDSWSVGVVMLEMILGTHNVFSVDQRTQALILRQLEGQSEEHQQRALLLAAMADFCIYLDDPLEHPDMVSASLRFAGRRRSETLTGTGKLSLSSLRLPGQTASSARCGLHELAKAIQKRDPLEIGFNDRWGLDLLSKLLAWNVSERIPLSAAHRHAYFVGPYVSELDGTEHSTAEECLAHDFELSESDDSVDFAHPVSRRAYVPRTKQVSSSSQELQIRLRTRMDAKIEEKCSANAPSVLYPLAQGMEHEIRASYFASALGYSHLIAGADAHATIQADIQRTQLGDTERHMPTSFACESCARVFDNYQSCLAHSTARKHGIRCLYDAERVPPCLSHHSMLPADPKSGWCDLQGRRNRLEDWHSIVFTDEYKFYGVMDGHFGARAAKYASKHLHRAFQAEVNKLRSRGDAVADTDGTIHARNGESFISEAFLVDALRRAFLLTHNAFLKSSPASDISGTTATTAVVLKDLVAVANVGDSSAVACCDDQFRPVLLTVDHTPYLAAETQRVVAQGGFIEEDGVLRVNGSLAITRSLGDRTMDAWLEQEPNISLLEIRQDGTIAVRNGRAAVQQPAQSALEFIPRVPFLIVASDGLWDVLSTSDAVAIVAAEIRKDLSNSEQGTLSTDFFEEVARLLAVEAFVRGSMDNIGVCVVQLNG